MNDCRWKNAGTKSSIYAYEGMVGRWCPNVPGTSCCRSHQPSFWRGQQLGQARPGRQAGNSTCQEGNYEALAPVRPLQTKAGHEFDRCWAGRDLRTGSWEAKQGLGLRGQSGTAHGGNTECPSWVCPGRDCQLSWVPGVHWAAANEQGTSL